MKCYGCFKEYDGSGICPHCKYDEAKEREKYPLALHPGSILNGRYIVGRVLGQGGFGITYSAWDDQQNELIAIKEYFPTEHAGRAFESSQVQVYSGERQTLFEHGKEQFLAEARTLAGFNGNEHIVRIFSYFEENNTAYFTMEYVSGKSLDKYASDFGGRISTKQANELLWPIMEALDFIHSKGVVHRDIAPDNILVTKNGIAKLIDFGAARYSTGEKSKSLDVIIKEGFAPKEQYLRRAKQGPFTDVYAMAATYYYAITGKIPPASIARIEEDELIVPSVLGVKMPGAAEDALLKALEISAGERYQTICEFRTALEESMVEPIPEIPAPAPEKTPEKKASPFKVKKLAVGAVAALAVCIGAVVLIPKLSNDAASGKIVTENAETPLENVSIESFADKIDSPPLDISWEYDDATGTLLVSGTGNMEDYSMETPAPWAAHKADVAMVDIDDGILSVGKNAFADFNNLTFVSLPECLETIGDNAFSGSEIRHLCYAGDEGDWANVNVSSGNEKLFDAEFYPNSECSRARFIENSAYNTERFNCSLINYRPLVARNEGTLSLLYAGDGMELRVEHDDVYIALSGHELKESYTVNLEGSKAYQTEYSLRFMIPGRMMIEVAPSPTFTDTREIGIDDMQARLYCADAYDEESGKTKYYFVGPADLDVSYEDLTINLHFYNYYGIFYEPEEITNIDVTLYDITKDTSKQFNTITRIYSSELAENVDIPVDSTENDEHSQSAELVAYGDAGSNIAWSLDSEGVLLLEGSGDMVNYNSDSRKAPWSDYSNQIRTIRMSDGITSVGEFAFPGCENLLEVEFSKDTTRVGVMAFGNCSNLTAVKLPHGVVDVGGSSFYECTSLKDVSLPETVINIRGYAFFRCSSLESFTIPGSVTEIEAYAFYGCNKLESIFFNGTYADWRRVTVHDGNHPIINTTIGTKQN